MYVNLEENKETENKVGSNNTLLSSDILKERVKLKCVKVDCGFLNMSC